MNKLVIGALVVSLFSVQALARGVSSRSEDSAGTVIIQGGDAVDQFYSLSDETEIRFDSGLEIRYQQSKTEFVVCELTSFNDYNEVTELHDTRVIESAECTTKPI